MDVEKIKNKREKAIAKKYTSMGYSFLKKGWPDFLFFNDKGEIIFVEVKRKQKIVSKKMGLSAHQRQMEMLLNKCGKYVVEYVA